jgi:hypothetical protein
MCGIGVDSAISRAICFTNPTAHLDDHHQHINYGDLLSEWPKPTHQTLYSSNIFEPNIKIQTFLKPSNKYQSHSPQKSLVRCFTSCSSGRMSPASGVQLQHFESATGPGFDAQELTEGPGTPPTPRWSMGIKIFLAGKRATEM